MTLAPLLVMTDKIVILGDGEIELASQEIDISFNTRAREGLGLAAAALVTPFVKVERIKSSSYLSGTG